MGGCTNNNHFRFNYMKKITLTINGKEQTLTEGSVVEVVHRPLGQSAFALTSTIGYFTDVLDLSLIHISEPTRPY